MQLGDVCALRAGAAFKPELQGRRSGDLPFIKVSDFNSPSNGIRINEANNWVDTKDCRAIQGKPFEAGTVVFAKIGEALKQNRIRALTRPTFIDNNLMGAIAKPEAAERAFLFHLFRTIDIAASDVGTAVPYVKATTLIQRRVTIPGIAAQRRIAAVLDAYDDLIEVNRRRIALLEEMARALFEEWFDRFRFPGHESVMITETQDGPLPDGWRFGRVSDLLDFDPKTRVNREGDKPFISMGHLDTASSLIAPFEWRGGNSGAKFQNGDTLFARITPCLENGKTGIVRDLPGDGVGFGSTEFIIMRAATAGAAFAYCIARHDDFRRHAERGMSGASGRQRAKTEAVSAYRIALPPPESELLRTFEDIAWPMLRLAGTLGQTNENLCRARDLLLPRLISGRLTLPAVEKALESASVTPELVEAA